MIEVSWIIKDEKIKLFLYKLEYVFISYLGEIMEIR